MKIFHLEDSTIKFHSLFHSVDIHLFTITEGQRHQQIEFDVDLLFLSVSFQDFLVGQCRNRKFCEFDILSSLSTLVVLFRRFVLIPENLTGLTDLRIFQVFYSFIFQ